jgi:sugar transferase (PEP-CTERM system associated)
MKFATARLLAAVSLGVIFISVVGFLLPSATLWRVNSLYAMGLAIAALFVIRLALTQVAGAEAFRRRILVLGAGKRAARLRALADAPGSGLAVAGFVAMSGSERAVPGAVPREAISSLSDHAVALGAGEVVLAMEERRGALPLADLLRVKTTGVHVNDIASFIERETGRVDLATTNPSALIFSDGFSAGQRISRVGKRVFDIVASLLVLVVGLPLILIAGIAVKCDSRGPVFYRQSRVGLYGEAYDILKIRSMRTDAEAAGKAVWASENDPRITRVGHIIRKLRIDELPQLWCVLKGEMSIVGPRPERPSFVEELTRELPYYAERHMVKPGLTGWAQINYPYGASIEDARVKLEYDLYYAKNYSPFLDLLILLQTVRVVLWPEGAR